MLIRGDARRIPLADGVVNCCVTSPPYWGLRDYGVVGQLGLERTPEEYVARMVEVFREVRRVLRDDGTLWLNIGDCYYNGDKGGYRNGRVGGASRIQSHDLAADFIGAPNRQPHPLLKPKDLVGIPWMLAFALRADGWYLRSDIIWSKPNPMPESITDRPTKAHEYIFLMSKSERYYYNAEAIKEPGIMKNVLPSGWDTSTGNGGHGTIHKQGPTPRSDKQRGHSRRHAGFNERWDAMKKSEQCGGLRNKRSVWTVPPQGFPEAHFATFPEDLIKPCILAGCPAGGVVLDPFAGSGTTNLVARALNCKAIGLELNVEYLKIASFRLRQSTMQFP